MQSGTGYGAVNILTPSEALSDAAMAAQRATSSQLASATLPDEVQISGNKAKMSDLALVDAKSSSMVKDTSNQQALVANAMSKIDPNDPDAPAQWDEAMQQLVDKGVPMASQFIGRYQLKKQGQWVNALSAGTPQSALAAMQSDNPTGVGGAESGLASVAGGGGAGVSSGADPNSFDQRFSGATPQQLQTAYAHLEKIKSAIQAVAQAPNPQAAAQIWDQQAQELGMPDHVGKYSPQALQDLTQQTMPVDNYLRGRLVRESAGVPDAKPPPRIDNVGGALYSVDVSNPAKPVATALTPQGKGTLVGTDPDTGVGVYYDPVTGKETKGTEKLASKPGVTRGPGSSVFGQKQQAWLDVHPGDSAGALSYASGQHNMTAPQARTAAAAQASRDLQAITLSGGTVPDPSAFLQKAEDEHFAETMSSQGTAGVSAPPAAPASGRGALAGSAAWTPQQRAAVGRYPKNPTATAGTKERPFVPSSAAEYAKLPGGSFYIESDGTLKKKAAP